MQSHHKQQQQQQQRDPSAPEEGDLDLGIAEDSAHDGYEEDR